MADILIFEKLKGLDNLILQIYNMII